MTDFISIGNARDRVLSLRLDQVCFPFRYILKRSTLLCRSGLTLFRLQRMQRTALRQQWIREVT